MKTCVKEIVGLSSRERSQMLALLCRCFDGVSRRNFEADLSNKTLVIQMRDDAGELQGFSTLGLYLDIGPDGEPATIACSGDTIVAPEAWGSSALSRAWIGAAISWHRVNGQGNLYWLLITSGYRTYRFLPVFFERFHPCYCTQTPPHIADWMNRLATDRWGEAYDHDAGVVRFETPQRLRGSLAVVPDGKSLDPHVRHFLSLNPGHMLGDELVSVCELSIMNMTRAGRRMAKLACADETLPSFEVAR